MPGGNGAQNESGVIESLTIKLVAPQAVTREVGTSTPEGTEGNINEAMVFYTQDGDSWLTAKFADNTRQITLNGVDNNSTVYVVANYTGVFGGTDYIQAVTDALDAKANTNADASEYIENIVTKVSKEYLGKLRKNGGSFLMTGSAVTTSASGTAPAMLTVPLRREVAKVDFKLSTEPAPTGGNSITPNPSADNNTGIKGLIVMRSSKYVSPFALDGQAPTGYGLPSNTSLANEYFTSSTATDWAGFSKVTDINTTEETGAATAPHDYSFVYEYNGLINTNPDAEGNYIFDTFYVLPNYAEQLQAGTVIILATYIQGTMAGGAAANTDLRYYKARISGGLDQARTERNTRYVITAQLNGQGKGTVQEALDEDQEGDLVLTITPENWTLVDSTQELD